MSATVASGVVQTVLGEVPSTALGVTLFHEHLVVDLRDAWALEPRDERERAIAEATVELATLGAIRREPLLCRDNLVVDDHDMLAGELEDFRARGGTTIVDSTCQGMGRDAVVLRDLAIRTGAHIVASTGHYVWPCHPPDLKDRPARDITGEYTRDIEEGIGDTGVSAGMIGEIGLSDPLHPEEVRVLGAAVDAQRATGASLCIHPPWPSGRKLECVDLLIDAGADLERTVICHCDLEDDVNLLARLASLGITLGFDTFGHEHHRDRTGIADPRDSERLERLEALLEGGLCDSIVLSQDLACKIEWKAYGGWGLTHLDAHVVPALRARGVPDADIHAMRVANPARLLSRAL
jgi:phosphotriesterase-related protein